MDQPALSFFAFFQNEAVTHKLQPSQNPLSFAYNFCHRLTFASEFFFRSRAQPINNGDYSAAAA